MVHSQVNDVKLPTWVTVWFYITAVICTWDASFIMLRPHTLPGGSLAVYWYLYKYYVGLDRRYQDLSDGYVFAQSLLNYVEVVLNVVTLVMHYRKSQHTRLMAFTVSVMTFWKTVLYFLMFSEYGGGGVYRQGNSGFAEFVLVCIPNGFWIVVPFGVMLQLWGGLMSGGRGHRSDLGDKGKNSKASLNKLSGSAKERNVDSNANHPRAPSGNSSKKRR